MNQMAIAQPESSALDIFNFEGHDVRTTSDNGTPWFVATDVSSALDYRIAGDMVRNLDEDEKGTQIVRTPGGDQQMLVINESGLYSAILRSRKPEAKRFKKWVTSVLLPGLRKKEFVHISQAQVPSVNMDFIMRELSDLKSLVVSLTRAPQVTQAAIAAPVQAPSTPGQLSAREIKERGLLSTAKIAHTMGISTSRLNALLEILNLHARKANRHTLTTKGLKFSVNVGVVGTPSGATRTKYLWKPELLDAIPKKYYK